MINSAPVLRHCYDLSFIKGSRYPEINRNFISNTNRWNFKFTVPSITARYGLPEHTILRISRYLWINLLASFKGNPLSKDFGTSSFTILVSTIGIIFNENVFFFQGQSSERVREKEYHRMVPYIETSVMVPRTRTNSNDQAKSGNHYNHLSPIYYNAISRDREQENWVPLCVHFICFFSYKYGSSLFLLHVWRIHTWRSDRDGFSSGNKQTQVDRCCWPVLREEWKSSSRYIYIYNNWNLSTNCKNFR